MSWVTERTRRAATTAVVVWRRRGRTEVRVYAFAGWGAAAAVAEAWRTRTARRKYR